MSNMVLKNFESQNDRTAKVTISWEFPIGLLTLEEMHENKILFENWAYHPDLQLKTDDRKSRRRWSGCLPGEGRQGSLL